MQRRRISNPIVVNILILGLLLCAFGLRLYRVSSVPTNFDERITIGRYVSLPIIDIFKTLQSNNHPLSAALAHLFSPNADNIFMMRWPFILIGLLSLSLIYRFSAGLAGSKIGILTLFLASMLPVHLGYSVTIRGYIGFVALITTSFYFLWQALKRNRWRDWLGVVVSNILAIYFHLFGILAASTALGLGGLWLFGIFDHLGWYSNRRESSPSGLTGSRQWLKSACIKFSLVTSGLMLFYVALAYSRVNSVFSEGGYIGEFEVWRNGFSWPEDLWPVFVFASIISPISPYELGIYIYLFFGGIGLFYLWRQQRLWAITALIWFCAPFIIIFVAMLMVGEAFYAYSRFLLYLMPAFLFLVASGMVTVDDWLLAFANNRGRGRRITVQVVRGGIIIGVLSLIVVSLNWHFLRATHTDWVGIANTISRQLQPQDIVICEESIRDFEPPDRAKPHCIWLLGFHIPELQEYTPRFQSSTDFVANYNNLQEQRANMLKPGSVWLIIWQKIHFHPGIFISAERPEVMSPPPLDAFKPYQAWHFGSATLIHIDSEETLLGNVYKSVELLLQLEQSPAAKARGYRNLAELEAVQGHTEKAREFLKMSWALVEQAGGQYPELYLRDTKLIVDRLPDDHLPPKNVHPINYQFGRSLCLRAYEISPTIIEKGQIFNLTLYWETLDFINEDYAFFLNLNDELGQTQGSLGFSPFDESYPTPWWWAKQQLVERRKFVVPPDLPGQDYTVQLVAYDRRGLTGAVLSPLSLMLYQPNQIGEDRWGIEAATDSASICP